MGLRPAAQGHLAMLSFSALVAGSFALGARVANEIDPAALTTVRFLIAAVVIGVLLLMRGGGTRQAARAPWRYLVLGLLYCIYFVLMFEGLKTARSVSASAVFTLTPLLSALFGWLLLRQRTTPRMALALVVGGAGALWVIFDADPGALLAFDIGRGEFIFFWGVIAHALYTPLVRRLNRGESPLVFTFGTLLAASALLLAWGWRDLLATDWAALRPMVWITILYVAIAASATTFLLLQFATLRLPSAKVMAYTYLTPTWVICWELALGGTPPQGLVAIGVVLTIMALLLLLRDEEPELSEEPA